MSLLLLCLAAVAGYAAWAFAALSMPVHWHAIRALSRHAPPSRWLMRALALLFAGAAASLCILRDGWGLGTLLGVCIACTSAYAVVLTLSCFDGKGAPGAGARGGPGV
jgi:hypothetical protein